MPRTTRSGSGWPRPEFQWPFISETVGTRCLPERGDPNPTLSRFGEGSIFYPGSLCPIERSMTQSAAWSWTESLAVTQNYGCQHRERLGLAPPTGEEATQIANQSPRSFSEDPFETIRHHVWVTPYYEEDIRKLADLIGTERVLFGSDWPHGEGLAEPLSFTKELHAFTDGEIRMIMRGNALDLLGVG